MVRDYDPTQEFVLVLLKPWDRTSIYRVCALPPDGLVPETNEAVPSQGGYIPDLETLMEWEADGGCKTACSHGCWVEPDSTCSHGNPSWLLKLGLI
jgi:hypothetical protein